jgi:hypothetical protein
MLKTKLSFELQESKFKLDRLATKLADAESQLEREKKAETEHGEKDSYFSMV